MQLSNLALNLRGPWMITPEHAAIMAPILKGVLQGYITEFDKAPDPYRVKCAEYAPASSGKGGDFADKSVYVTYLTGTMMKYDQCDAPGTRTIGQGLLDADRDPDIVGHIIIADSGGGAANAVPELADAIRACTKPVVAWVDGLAGSACMYAISYCSRILAHQPMDTVGSIGTILEISGYPKFHKDADGYVTARIYADAATEKNAGYEAALEGNFQVVKEERLNPMNDVFVNDMKANRPNLTPEQLSGRTYFAKDAIGSFIDAIGSFGDAVQAVLELAEEKAAAMNQNNPKQSTTMPKYPTLMALASFAGLVLAADGTTTLQASQLEELEAALAGAAGQQSIIDGLNQQLEQANATISERDARVTELESSLNAALQRAEEAEAKIPGIEVKHNPEGAADLTPAETFDEALKACETFLGK